MAVDVTLTNVGSGFNRTKINDNFDAIEEAFQDTLSRTGDSPNQMEADLDMNGNDILNIDTLDVENLSVQGVDLTDLVDYYLGNTPPTPDWKDRANNLPFLVMVEGQSNAAYDKSYSWGTAPDNLYVWNWSTSDVTAATTGTAFTVADTTNISWGVAFARRLAADNPDRNVYVVRSALGGQAIAQWLVGAAAPDMYALNKRNMEAALAVIDTDVQLIHLRWQGETDAFAASATYIADFATYLARLRAETWYPYNTPIITMGYSRFTASTNVTHGNRDQARLSSEHSNVMYVDPNRALPSSGQWDPAVALFYVHPLGGLEYDKVGAYTYNQFYNNAGWGPVGLGVYIDPVSAQMLQTYKCVVNARSGTAITATNLMSGWTEDFDNLAAFDHTTGIFTVPCTGVYRVSYTVQNQNSASQLTPQIYVDGFAVAGTAAATFAANATVSKSCLLYLQRNSGVGVAIIVGTSSNNSTYNSISIEFVS